MGRIATDGKTDGGNLDSLWDSFRSQIPFLTLVDPSSVEEMIRSLIDTYVHLGWLPDCRMSLNKGYTQVSMHTRVLLRQRERE